VVLRLGCFQFSVSPTPNKPHILVCGKTQGVCDLTHHNYYILNFTLIFMSLKRGELTSSQIITIVLAIAGFMVVLIFFVRVYQDGGQEETELCRFSVLTRATSPIGSLQSSIPLKCTTQKYCISESGKKDACSQFAGEDNIRSVKLKGSDEEKARKIEETTANVMFDCWSMMGEGKLEIFSGTERPDGIGGGVFEVARNLLNIPTEVNPTCVICGRVALADDLFDEENKEVLRKVDVNEYINDEFIPGSPNEKYIDFFTGSEQARGFLDKEFFDKSLKLEITDEEGRVIDSHDIEKPEATNQLGFVFMQILTEESALKAASDAGTATAFAFAGAAVAGPGRVLSIVSIKVQAVVALATVGLTAGFSYFRQDANQIISAGYCGPFTKEGRRSQGCSLLKPVDYNDVGQINDLCNIIEGNP